MITSSFFSYIIENSFGLSFNLGFRSEKSEPLSESGEIFYSILLISAKVQ